MNKGLSARDLELVSAYLDNALPPEERAAFEQRLKAEPALAHALTDLEGTRILLRRAPQRRAPRSFALRADMVSAPQKTIFGGWTSLNLVSAAATLVLMLIFAGDIWANRLLLVGAAAPAAEEFPQALMTEEPAAEDAVLTPTPTEPTTEGAGEIDLYAAEGAERQTKDVGAPFNLRFFLINYARTLEIGLAFLAVGAGLVAWWRRRNP